MHECKNANLAGQLLFIIYLHLTMGLRIFWLLQGVRVRVPNAPVHEFTFLQSHRAGLLKSSFLFKVPCHSVGTVSNRGPQEQRSVFFTSSSPPYPVTRAFNELVSRYKHILTEVVVSVQTIPYRMAIGFGCDVCIFKFPA